MVEHPIITHLNTIIALAENFGDEQLLAELNILKDEVTKILPEDPRD